MIFIYEHTIYFKHNKKVLTKHPSPVVRVDIAHEFEQARLWHGWVDVRLVGLCSCNNTRKSMTACDRKGGSRDSSDPPTRPDDCLLHCVEHINR